MDVITGALADTMMPQHCATEHCVTTADRSVRMFEHDWTERCSHVHPVVPHLIFWPLIVTLLATAHTTVAGPVAAPPLFAGFVVGYLVYDTVHYAVHHPGLPTTWGRFLKRRHVRHHFVDADRDYGVSSPLWDWVLGTLGGRHP